MDPFVVAFGFGVWLGTALIARVAVAGLRSALGADAPSWLIPVAPLAAGSAAFLVHRLHARPEVAPA